MTAVVSHRTAQIRAIQVQVERFFGRHLNRPILQRKPTVPITPQIHVTKAASGRACCSLPDMSSGAKRLISTTDTQMAAAPSVTENRQDASKSLGKVTTYFPT